MSFRATLEEVLAADIIVHVRDIANENTAIQRRDVISVLKSLGLNDAEDQNNYIELLNKTDLLSPEQQKNLKQNKKKNTLPVSALTGEGIEDFLNKIDETLSEQNKTVSLNIPAADGALLSWLHQNALILNTRLQEDKLCLELKISEANLSKLQHRTSSPVKFI